VIWWTKPRYPQQQQQPQKKKKTHTGRRFCDGSSDPRPLIATLTKLVENKNGDEDPPESHKPKYKYFTN